MSEDSPESCKQAVAAVQSSATHKHDIVNERVPFDPHNKKLYPLHLAALRGQRLMVQQLLMLKAVASLESADCHLATFYALVYGQDAALVRLLMHACPVTDSKGRTVEDYMAELQQGFAVLPNPEGQPPAVLPAPQQHHHHNQQQHEEQEQEQQWLLQQMPALMSAEVQQEVRKLSTQPAINKRTQMARTAAAMWRTAPMPQPRQGRRSAAGMLDSATNLMVTVAIVMTAALILSRWSLVLRSAWHQSGHRR